ncbi:hypothetical protein Cfor_05892 [Coptotermes formosanus]|jgi:hypothetical protein|uniref:Uncharacterized protein n=1 Tax=Coptotermes formosanus TaxID=36987 RepID=A0A6L2QAR9_COPFO|nr:hypothetical protein Cfor_05892 [Coptotermes formosanus]
MAERLFWFLLLLSGFQAPLKAVSLQIVAVPSKSELTQEFIHSERLHTDNVSAAVALPDGSKGYGNNTCDGCDTPNLQVSGTVNLNKIVDEMLDILRVEIIQRGRDRITIPDVHETFKKKVGPVTVKGEFDCENGWVKNLSTVHRTADVVASSYDRWISVSCGFGLGDLELGYDNYAARIMRLGTRGKISGTVAKNSILLNATVTWANHTCNITLDELSLNQFGGLDLSVTGLGLMNWLFSKIFTWVLQHFKSEVKDQIEYTLTEEIEKYLSNFNCSNYFPKL